MKKVVPIVLVLILFFIQGASVPAEPAAKKALFVWGGWEGHEPKQCVDIFAPWLEEQGFDVVISHSLDSYLDKELMQSLDLIVQSFTMAEINREQEKGLLEAVKGGVALAGETIRNISLWSVGSGWLTLGGLYPMRSI